MQKGSDDALTMQASTEDDYECPKCGRKGGATTIHQCPASTPPASTVERDAELKETARYIIDHIDTMTLDELMDKIAGASRSTTPPTSTVEEEYIPIAPTKTVPGIWLPQSEYERLLVGASRRRVTDEDVRMVVMKYGNDYVGMGPWSYQQVNEIARAVRDECEGKGEQR